MPLGDSITFGAGCGAGGAYRQPLGDQATRGGYTISYVGSQSPTGSVTYGNGCEAYPGNRIDELTVEVSGKLTTYQPDLVIAYVGMNDCIQDYQFSTVATRYRALINQILAEKPTVKIMACMLNPSSDADVNGRITQLNAQISGIVADYAGVYVADGRAGFDASIHLSDTVHPNCGGYNQLGASLYYRGLEGILRGG